MQKIINRGTLGVCNVDDVVLRLRNNVQNIRKRSLEYISRDGARLTKPITLQVTTCL